MNLLKRHIVEDYQRGAGRHDDPKVFGGPAGDLGLVGGPDSISWKVNSDIGAIAVGGVSAIILEILHPSVMAGVQELSSYREDPFRRGRTTFGYVVTTTFGNSQAARRLIGAVKSMHKRVNGTRPDGVPYRALDPELIGWVHTCIPWAVMTAYERYNQPLTAAERDRYLSEQAIIGRMGGAEDIPETMDELADFVEGMRPKLTVNEQTREFVDFLVDSPFGVRPPGPLERPAKRFQVAAGMSLAPRWTQDLTGLRNAALIDRLVAQPSLHLYARTLRWAFGTPPYVRLAQERVGLGGAEHATAAPAVGPTEAVAA